MAWQDLADAGRTWHQGCLQRVRRNAESGWCAGHPEAAENASGLIDFFLRSRDMTVKGKDQGFTLIELLIVVAIISIIAAIAVPGLLRARMTGNETSAIASLKVVTSSQVAYSASCGQNGYATSFIVLGTPAPGTTEGFISADLGTVV